jgi:hypothetical protein
LFKDGEEQDNCWGFLGSFDKAKAAIREYLPEEVVPLIDVAEYGSNEPKQEQKQEPEQEYELEDG